MAATVILMQKFEYKLHRISIYTLTLIYKGYPAIKLEFMSIYKSINVLKDYLHNRQLTALADGKHSLHFRKTSIPTDVSTLWLLELSRYTINFKHIPNKKNLFFTIT